MKKQYLYIKNGLLILLSLLVMGIIFIYIFNINRFSGLTGDDFLYHFVYTGEWPAKGGVHGYHNLWDWLVAIYNHMTLWNARLTSIIFEITAMQFPKAVFNIVNTIAYLIVGLEMSILANGKRALTRPLQLLLTYLLMWFFLSGFGSTVLWVSGAANYLWPSVIILAFFMLYRFNYHVKKHFTLMAWVAVVLAILSGMANEVGSSTAFLVVGLFTFFNRPKGVLNDYWWKLVGVVTTLVAFLTMLFLSSKSTESVTYGKNGLVYHVTQIFSETLSNSGVLIFVTLVLGIVVLFSQPDFFRGAFSKRELTADEQSTLSGIIFFVSGLAGVGALIISPVLFPRLWFAINVLLIISLLNFLASYQMLRKDAFFTYTVLTVATAGVLFLAIPSYRLHLKDIKPFYNVFYTHEKIAEKARRHGDQIVEMPGIPVSDDVYNPYTGTPYIMPGNPKKQWANTWMANYWHVHEIRLDNNVPVQKSPQQDLPLIDTIYRWYDQQFGMTELFNKLKLTNVTVQPKYVVSIKNDTNQQPKIQQQPDNSNLSKDKPWLRNALVRYLDVTTNRVVGTEQITSPNFNTYDISHASISGYQTLTKNPKSYYFTDSYHQLITIRVKPPMMHLNMYYNVVKHDKKQRKVIRIATVHINARSGQIATLKAPKGYTFSSGRPTKQVKVNDASSERGIQLIKLPLLQRLKAYRGAFWLAGIMLLWLALDVAFTVIPIKWRKRKKKD